MDVPHAEQRGACNFPALSPAAPQFGQNRPSAPLSRCSHNGHFGIRLATKMAIQRTANETAQPIPPSSCRNRTAIHDARTATKATTLRMFLVRRKEATVCAKPVRSSARSSADSSAASRAGTTGSNRCTCPKRSRDGRRRRMRRRIPSRDSATARAYETPYRLPPTSALNCRMRVSSSSTVMAAYFGGNNRRLDASKTARSSMYSRSSTSRLGK